MDCALVVLGSETGPQRGTRALGNHHGPSHGVDYLPDLGHQVELTTVGAEVTRGVISSAAEPTNQRTSTNQLTNQRTNQSLV